MWITLNCFDFFLPRGFLRLNHAARNGDCLTVWTLTSSLRLETLKAVGHIRLWAWAQPLLRLSSTFKLWHCDNLSPSLGIGSMRLWVWGQPLLLWVLGRIRLWTWGYPPLQALGLRLCALLLWVLGHTIVPRCARIETAFSSLGIGQPLLWALDSLIFCGHWTASSALDSLFCFGHWDTYDCGDGDIL